MLAWRGHIGMALDRWETIQHLLRIGILSSSDMVCADISVVAVESRNTLVLIEYCGRGVVVKQPKDAAAMDAATLWTEASMFWLTRNDAGFSALTRWMPRFLHYDEPQRILTIEYLVGAPPLTEHLWGMGVSPDLIGEVGIALATLHGPVSQAAIAGPSRRLFPPLLPWVLTLGAPDVRYAPATAASLDVLRRFLGQPEAAAALWRIRAGWTGDQIIHGDIKAPNILIVADGTFRIIDWELATFGDGLWDVAGLLHSMLIPNPAGPPEPLDQALRRVQPLAEALWRSYAATLVAGRRDAAARMLAMCGARIVQTCLESTHHGTLAPGIPTMLDAAIRLMTRPDVVRRQWGWA